MERDQVGDQEWPLHHPDRGAGRYHHLSLLHHRIHVFPGRFPDGGRARSQADWRR